MEDLESIVFDTDESAYIQFVKSKFHQEIFKNRIGNKCFVISNQRYSQGSGGNEHTLYVYYKNILMIVHGQPYQRQNEFCASIIAYHKLDIYTLFIVKYFQHGMECRLPGFPIEKFNEFRPRSRQDDKIKQERFDSIVETISNERSNLKTENEALKLRIKKLEEENQQLREESEEIILLQP
jgi:hypothetical protein